LRKTYANEVKYVSVDGIQPSPDEVVAGRYAIYRPFVLVTKGAPSGFVSDFIQYILSEKGQDIVSKNGLIPIKPSD